jgi:hypothetical protein
MHHWYQDRCLDLARKAAPLALISPPSIQLARRLIALCISGISDVECTLKGQSNPSGRGGGNVVHGRLWDRAWPFCVHRTHMQRSGSARTYERGERGKPRAVSNTGPSCFEGKKVFECAPCWQYKWWCRRISCCLIYLIGVLQSCSALLANRIPRMKFIYWQLIGSDYWRRLPTGTRVPTQKSLYATR